MEIPPSCLKERQTTQQFGIEHKRHVHVSHAHNSTVKVQNALLSFDVGTSLQQLPFPTLEMARTSAEWGQHYWNNFICTTKQLEADPDVCEL